MTPPHILSTQSEGQLKRRVLTLARAEGVPERRIRDWIGYTVIAAVLDDAKKIYFVSETKLAG